jgi:magnesium transporter
MVHLCYVCNSVIFKQTDKVGDKMIQSLSKDEILLRIIKDVKESNHRDFHELIDELHPIDIAEIYIELPSKHQAKFLGLLSLRQMATLIQELDSNWQIKTLQKIGIERSSKVMNYMENDDVADMLANMTVEEIEELLASMREEESKHVQNLMQYPADTAGGRMTNRFVWIRNSYTVNEAIDKLRSFADFAETIYYLYVLDQNKQLVGVVSYRDLILASPNEKVENIMYTRVIAVPADMDQEEVATIIQKYDFIAIPVVNETNLLLGIVTIDDIMDVLIEEANEDIGRFAATGGKTIDFQTSILTSAARRLPWLILLLFIGLGTGLIMSRYEATLDQIVILAFFLPLIAGMTGNTGTQSLAVVIRGLVNQEMNTVVVMKLISREAGVGILIGLVCSFLVATVSYMWQGSLSFSIVIGISLFLCLIVGTLAGTIIPLILYRFNVDPAVASGPFITTINDIFSLLIYFNLATYVLLPHIKF